MVAKVKKLKINKKELGFVIEFLLPLSEDNKKILQTILEKKKEIVTDGSLYIVGFDEGSEIIIRISIFKYFYDNEEELYKTIKEMSQNPTYCLLVSSENDCLKFLSEVFIRYLDLSSVV